MISKCCPQKALLLFVCVVGVILVKAQICPAEDEIDPRITCLEYTIQDAQTGEKKGEVRIKIDQSESFTTWHEVRTLGHREKDVFDVVFDPHTLRPKHYERKKTGPEGTMVLYLTVEERRVTAQMTHDGGEGTACTPPWSPVSCLWKSGTTTLVILPLQMPYWTV